MLPSLHVYALQLYANDPANFIAARNTQARAIKPFDSGPRDGTRRAAKTIAGSVDGESDCHRAHRPVARPLRLGEQMRQAQAEFDRDSLTRLSLQRRNAIGSLVAEAATIAASRAGVPTKAVLAEVEQTLQAGTSETDAAAAVASGLLVRGLRAVGFEPVDLQGALALDGVVSAPRTTSPRKPVQLADARRRKAAREELEALERKSAEAQAQVNTRERDAQRLEKRRGSLHQQAEEARERLLSAEQTLATADAEHRDSLEALARVRSVAEESRRRADKARVDLDRALPRIGAWRCPCWQQSSTFLHRARRLSPAPAWLGGWSRG